MSTRYLSVAHVIGLYYEAMRLAGEEPAALVRPEALESAIHRPRAAAYYGEVTLVEQAAELGEGIALAHPWVDGNKRCAFVSMITFLEHNGVPVPSPEDDRYLHAARLLVDLVATTSGDRGASKQRLIEELNSWATGSNGS